MNLYDYFLHLNTDIILLIVNISVADDACDEWGGAESRGNGARPVE